MNRIPKSFTCDLCNEDNFVIFVNETKVLCVGCLSVNPELYESDANYKYGDRVQILSMHNETIFGTVIYKLDNHLYEVELDRDKPTDESMESYRDGRRCKYYTDSFHASELKSL